MALPVPNLDNRRFQDIVDEAKRLIPKYCPEWTDHNVSDPGIALIELFAWMTETLLYRVNQVPEKNYIKFLDMIGIRLSPPRSATAEVSFYLSAAQPDTVTIPEGTEVATVRTETTPAIVFTTERDLIIRPPAVCGIYTHQAARDSEGWVQHDSSRLEFTEESIIVFPNPPAPNDGFYIAFDEDHSRHIIALTAGCKQAGGTGIDPSNPPFVWEVWQGALPRWVQCRVEHEGTGGFNHDGEIVVHLPVMVQETFNETKAYWLRCRLTDEQTSANRYLVSPEIERYLRIESRGGTVGARHAITVKDEMLGISDGTPGQSFKLSNLPVLARNPQTDYLVVQRPDGEPDQWREVPDFADTGADDKCFTLDSIDGTLTLGPSLLQPDGSVFHFGAVPPMGSTMRFSRYQYGGGVIGNVPAGAISVLKASLSYVAQVTNLQPAVGGRDGQNIEDAKLKAGQHLRSYARAVTAGDFEFHACQVPGIARARSLSPGAQPGDATAIRPGQVFVIVLPHAEFLDLKTPQQLMLPEDMRKSVLDYLTPRCVLGISVEARLPEFIWVSVKAELLVAEHSNPAVAMEVQRQAEDELYRYLNPYTGGPQKNGWPFGRDLHLSELYGLLQRIPSVEYVEAVRLEISEPGRPMPRPAPPRISLGRHQLICSGRHGISVGESKKIGQSG
jgi:predicted phage baseplate assembly protein